MSDHPAIDALLAELDRDVSVLRPEQSELRRLFVEAAEPLAKLLMSVGRNDEGHSGFAVLQMSIRGLNDLVVAFHLAEHAYINQAYNDMRIAWEACDLIKLVSQDSEEADKWLASEQPWREFGAKRVRDKLWTLEGKTGESEADPLYSFFCQMAHPRMAGADLTGYMTRHRDTGAEQIEFSLGPSPLIDERPYLAHCLTLMGIVLGRLTIESHQLVFLTDVTATAYSDAAHAMVKALRDYLTAGVELMAKSGQPDAKDGIEALGRMFVDVLKDI